MSNHPQRGFTLVELIIFIVVVSVGLAGILAVMDTTVKSSADPMVRKQAMALAESILEEIMLTAYADPDGTNVGETGRTDWDNVNDFAGKTAADFSLTTILPGYELVITVGDDTSTLGSAPNIPAKKVTVTVSKGAESVSMIGYRANY